MSDKRKSELKIKSWYSNRSQFVEVQRNILLLFTLVSMFSVAVAVIFVKNVMASKSIEPYIVQVEDKSGVATVVDQLTSEQFTGDQAIRKYFVNDFVHCASGYDPKSYKKDAEKIRLYSTPGIYADFRNRINARDLGPDTVIDIRVKSMQPVDANTLQIRMVEQTTRKDSSVQTKDKIVTMGFYFAPQMNLTMEERLINPLGFQVNRYQISEEVYSY